MQTKPRISANTRTDRQLRINAEGARKTIQSEKSSKLNNLHILRARGPLSANSRNKLPAVSRTSARAARTCGPALWARRVFVTKRKHQRQPQSPSGCKLFLKAYPRIRASRCRRARFRNIWTPSVNGPRWKAPCWCTFSSFCSCVLSKPKQSVSESRRPIIVQGSAGLSRSVTHRYVTERYTFQSDPAEPKRCHVKIKTVFHHFSIDFLPTKMTESNIEVRYIMKF
ncbi:hypothetical protein EVAR_10075_1 [Eumeta japonica]|uniref:Uncharacterized protein n=1 Tax=Eumeta variegata TaxID=151549 RepID=A0A4C1TRJ1_EUMVA|nr:hypothetical protein EVAR_10075_1 [Eumeta japonica]